MRSPLRNKQDPGGGLEVGDCVRDGVREDVGLRVEVREEVGLRVEVREGVDEGLRVRVQVEV